MTALPAFDTLPARVQAFARDDPARTALIADGETTSWGALDQLADRVASALRREGAQRGDTIALCAANCTHYVAYLVGVLRAGMVVVPLPTGATGASLVAMLRDAAARVLITDEAADRLLAPMAADITAARWSIDDPRLPATASPPESRSSSHLAQPASWDVSNAAVHLAPESPFNLIYSSGTTGSPKGIVQSHAMRWAHIRRGELLGYDRDAITMAALPLYSNSALVSLLPALGMGGTLVLMRRFDAATFLTLAQQYRATHAMLVPILYERLLAHPDFDRTDLSAFRMKTCTSAPFAANTKRELLRRWPGALFEFYGMSEGGASCMLDARAHPDRLHTVGRPQPGHEIRLIDDAGREVALGDVGEVVGRSPMMMTGYHNLPAASAAAEWHDAEGRRFIRHGDLGRLDADGFLTLVGRVKDVIISGGQNVYPSDLEAVLRTHPAVADVAVIGVPSAEWGETPVAFVVPVNGATFDPDVVRTWANAQLGRSQRIAAVHRIDTLPRSAIGKVLRRTLRERWMPTGT